MRDRKRGRGRVTEPDKGFRKLKAHPTDSPPSNKSTLPNPSPIDLQLETKCSNIWAHQGIPCKPQQGMNEGLVSVFQISCFFEKSARYYGPGVWWWGKGTLLWFFKAVDIWRAHLKNIVHWYGFWFTDTNLKLILLYCMYVSTLVWDIMFMQLI